MLALSLWLAAILSMSAQGLDNGVALTPPMSVVVVAVVVVVVVVVVMRVSGMLV